ncbi:hypothetical protein MsAg5_06980 [Methanosarcinaceae archaeon Ag5]|uniref:Uncharacterized protein n=2 Tax=Methanolapillus africanus TaxID=3028297 RepID=A0AAE4MJ06_9EURY|nr:hypothetical protein [Methanosarcinaceae archaeon Ag5]
MKQKKNLIYRLFKDKSGASAVFGALLLLGIAAVAASVIAADVLPAISQKAEEKEERLFFAAVVSFSEKMDRLMKQSVSFTGRNYSLSENQIIAAENSSVFADENAGCFLIWTNATLPPSSTFLIAKNHSFSEPETDRDEDENETRQPYEALTLSQGSVLFFKTYDHLPDQMYFYGPSSFILAQRNGAASVFSPQAVTQNDGKTLISLSGQVFKSHTPAVESDQKNIRFDVTKTATIRDRVNYLEIQYVPNSLPASEFSDFYNYRNKKIEEQMAAAAEKLNALPGWTSAFDPETKIIQMESEIPFEIEIVVSEIEIEFG